MQSRRGMTSTPQTVADLPLPRRVRLRLVEAGGIQTLDELCARSPNDLRKIPLFGTLSLLAVERALANVGRSLRGQPVPDQAPALPAWVKPEGLETGEFAVWRELAGSFHEYLFRVNGAGMWFSRENVHKRRGVTQYTNVSVAPLDVWEEAVRAARRLERR